jgi:type II secretory ATPase GspE/PulE/Tfp pilus assembly ATPase PilB-like protein
MLTMGVEPFLLASTLRMVLAQRLPGSGRGRDRGRRGVARSGRLR